MRIFNLLNNIASKIKRAIAQIDANLTAAKNYSNTNLQTAKNYTDSVVGVDKYRFIYRRSLSSTDNINDIKTMGVYTIGASTPIGIANTFTWSYVIVISRGDMVHQFIAKPVTGWFLMREYSGSPSSWHPWKKFTTSNY